MWWNCWTHLIAKNVSVTSGDEKNSWRSLESVKVKKSCVLSIAEFAYMMMWTTQTQIAAIALSPWTGSIEDSLNLVESTKL